MSGLSAFQIDEKIGNVPSEHQNYFALLEAGLATEKNVPPFIYYMSLGQYENALIALHSESDTHYPSMKSYLENLIPVFAKLEKKESENFKIYSPSDQSFLSDYALSALESAAGQVEKLFGHRPHGKISVEIYPTKEEFSLASTLTLETLERSGAIGICKFHRLMILSPKALPMGYRWLDALSHEYMHLIINEITRSNAELWLHEGTARYFETVYRLNPPVYLTPHQKTKLLEAQKSGSLISFKRMSPSMVYLKNQEEVSLAFAEVSYAIGFLINQKKHQKFVSFLKMLKKSPFSKSFFDTYGITPEAFEVSWVENLLKESWEKTKGAMSDEVRFRQMDEFEGIGADVQGRIRIGDRMRRQGHLEAALIEYEKALLEEPDNAFVLLKAAKTHLALEQKDKAAEKLNRAVVKNPNYGTPYVELAELVEGEKAVGCLLEANAINPFDPRIHKGLEQLFEKSGRLQDSRREGAIYRILMMN